MARKGSNKSGNQEKVRHANRQKIQEARGKGKIKGTSNDKSQEGGRVIKEKFQEQLQKSLPPVSAKNEKQKHYLNILKTCNIIIVRGLFGTGKTYLASCVAGDLLRKKEIEQIIVARPYVQTGKTSGFKPGTSYEKLYPYVRNVLDTVKSRMGDGAYQYALKDGVSGQIEVQEVESIRGRSFDKKSFLILDEAQQTTPEEMKAIVTRIGDDCTLVLCGDESQRDIKGQSGLSWFSDFAIRHGLSGVGFVNFNEPSDIIRGGLVRDIAIGLARDDYFEKD